MSMIRDQFYTLDLLIGYAAPVVVLTLSRVRGMANLWRLFWLGVAVGLLWEIPIFVLSAPGAQGPIITFIRELPCHYGVFLVSHALWDGGLFLVGIAWIRLTCPAPILARFSTRELAVLLLWGQVSSLAVEMGSVLSDAWAFVPTYAWNPVLFRIQGHGITALMQLIWLAAPCLYYACALRMSTRR